MDAPSIAKSAIDIAKREMSAARRRLAIIAACAALSPILSTNACAQSIGNEAALEVADKCIAAMQRDPGAQSIMPSRAFCLCVWQRVSSSEDDLRSTTDRAGRFCQYMMNSPKEFGKGIYNGQFESCMRDKDLQSAYPKSHKEYCGCMGSAVSDELLSNRPLPFTEKATMKSVVSDVKNRALAACSSKLTR